MTSKTLDEITYSFPNFKGCTIDVWEWINNSTGHIIIYLYWDNKSPCLGNNSKSSKDKFNNQNSMHELVDNVPLRYSEYCMD